MKLRALPWLLALMTLLLPYVVAQPTDPSGVPDLLGVVTADGSTVPAEMFGDRLQVYIEAAPAEGLPVDVLPDGDYVFQVSGPDGVLLLSSDRALCRIFRVEDGVIVALRDPAVTELVDHTASDACHVDDDTGSTAGASGRHDTNLDLDDDGIVLQLMPYNPTPDPGGYYKLEALPLDVYLAFGGAILRQPRPMGAGFTPDPGFVKAKVALYDFFRVDGSALNQPPVADAGPDQSFDLGEVVTLDGSASSDADGDPLSYSWSLAAPAGSEASLDDANAVMPSFQPDLPGSYVATLVVNDGTVDSLPDDVVASSGNTAPVADAGPDRGTLVGVPVTLDGSGSSDVDGDPLSYQWRIPDPALAEQAIFENVQSVTPILTPLVSADFEVELVVFDGSAFSEPDSAIVSIDNQPPVALAGIDQSAFVGQLVELDGSASFDPDLDPLTYAWSLTAPAASAATLSDPTAVRPSFLIDRPGAYVGQLIVNDGEASSAPDTVLVTTENAPPVADAGPDQSVAPGENATLDGSGSFDPDGDALDYAWSLLNAPAGSNATIDDPSAVITSLTIDLPGSYVAQLIVDDGALASAPDSVMLTRDNVAPIADAGPDRVVLAGNQLTLDGNGSSDADGDALTFSWSLISRPAESNAVLESADSAMPQLFADRAGIYVAQLIVNDGVLDSVADSAVIEAQLNQRLLIETDSDLIGVERSVGGRVITLAPPPVGGLLVTLSSDDSGIAAIEPLSLTIPEGADSAPITVDGVALGETTLRAEAADYFPAATNVTVTEFLVSVDLSLALSPGQSAGLATSLSSIAPAGGQTVFLTSEDPSIATVTPSVFVPEGAQIPAVNPQVTGGAIGQTRIVATSPGYAPATAEITVTLEIFFEAERLRLPLETRLYRLRFSSPTPAEGLALQLSVDDPSIATVPAMLLVEGGVTVVDIPVTGLADGVTPLRVNSTGIAEATGSIEVFSGIELRSGLQTTHTVGRDLQRRAVAVLASSAPPEGRMVELTSADPDRLLLSTSATAEGSATISLLVPGGASSSEPFWMQSLDESGSVEITASAPAYTTEIVPVELVPSGFGFVLLPIATQGIFITTQDRDVTVAVQPLALTPATNAVLFGQELRAGTSADIAVELTDPSLASLSGSPIALVGGDGSGSALLNPLAPGSATIEVVQPAGFATPSSRTSLPLEISTPAITFGGQSFNRVVGYKLQTLNLSVGLGATAAEPVDITLSVDDPTRFLLAPPDGSSAGSATLVLENVTTGGSFKLYGLELGTATISASAPGFEPTAVDYQVVPSGFRFRFPASAINTTTITEPNVLSFEPVVIWSTIVATQAVRQLIPGFSGELEVVSSDPSVATIGGSPVAVDAPAIGEATAQPVAAGTTTLSVVQPPGFSPPQNYTQRTMTVTSPSINLSGVQSGRTRTGQGMQTLHSTTLDSTSAGSVDVTLEVADAAIATLSADPAVDGGGTLVLPNGTPFRIQGRSVGTTTLTLSSPGYLTLVVELEVTPSGFDLGSSFGIELLTFDPNYTLTVYPSAIDPVSGASLFIQNQTLLPGSSFALEVTSSAPGVVEVIGSPVTFSQGDLNRTLQLDPLTAGTAEVEVLQPAGFTATDRSSRTVVVEAPDVRLINAVSAVGVDLQGSITIALENAPPTPVDITVTSSSPDVVTLSRDRAAAGTASVTFTDVNSTFVGSLFVQGRSIGSVEIRAQAAGFDDGVRLVTTTPSGFVHGSVFPATVAANGTTLRQIKGARLAPNTLAFSAYQELRGGLSVEVALTNSEPLVAGAPSSLTLVGGDLASENYTIEGLAAGSTTLTVEPVAGFDTPADNRELTVNVIE